MNDFDTLIIVDSGVGNALESLYAIEYCLANNITAGIYMADINQSFQQHVKKCYGEKIMIPSLENISARNVIHCFTYQNDFPESFRYQNYFYIQPDAISTKFQSETEQYLSIVKALYPSDYKSNVLTKLKENVTERVQQLDIASKYVLYAGSTPENAMKRWPYFFELEKKLGTENCIYIGGSLDLDFQYSYYYPKWIIKLFPFPLLNFGSTWKIFKKLGLLRKHSHYYGINKKSNAYYNVFDWQELTAIFRRCKAFIGNDGGLTHLAAASGAKGIAIYGPTSVEKNKSYNPDLREIKLNYPCQPCQFGAGGIFISKRYINCPYQLRCMYDFSVDKIIHELEKITVL